MTNRILIIVAAVAILAAPAALAQPSFTEDFLSTAYRDAANTTVDWNTAEEELRPFPFTPSLAGAYDSSGDARDVAVTGDLAFLADGPAGLVVLDFTDPTNPVPLGTYDTPGIALGLAVDGDLVLVADDAGGLVAVDITNPAAPALLGTLATGDRARDVVIAGDRAYLADGAGGLLVVDIEDPKAMAVVGSYDSPGFGAGVAVSGNRAYLADGLNGLLIIDITDPTLPVLVGGYDSPGYANAVAVDGTTVFLADGATGLIPVDATDPSAPAPFAPFVVAGSALGVAAAGDLVHVASGAGGLTVVDATDPGALSLALDHVTGGYTYQVAVAGEHALLAGGASGLAVVAFTSFVAPAELGAYVVPGRNEYYVDVDVAGDLAVTVDYNDGFVNLYDLSDPRQPAPLGSVFAGAATIAVTIDGDHAYLATGTAGLVVVDLTDPANPTVVGSYDTQGEAADVEVVGDFAYVADRGLGLQIIDISDPASPSLAAFHLLSGGTHEVAVAGHHAYVADGSAGLQVIDISDPRIPVAAGSYATPADAYAVAVAGDLAVVSIGSADVAFEVVDISDPGAPSFVSTYQYQSGYTPYDLVIAGNQLFALDPWAVRVIDIADPTNPALLATTWQSASYSYLQGIALRGEDFVVVEVDGLVRVFQTYQHALASPTGNVGQSLALDGVADTVVRARLTSTPPSDVTWEINAAGDTSWTAAAAGAWTELVTPGTDLRWRSTHDWVPRGRFSVDDLTVEWLYQKPVITAVTDIANDQGRQVSLEWRRSGHDFLGDSTQITEYAVYRRIDPLKAAGLPPADLTGASAAVRDHARTAKAAGWHFVTTVPVRVEDDYAVVVPTLADSTVTAGQHFSTFMVSAMTATPGVFFDSPPDSGWSVDDLAPGAPTGMTAAYAAAEVVLDWEDAPEADFRYYRVYRDVDPGFTPGPENLVRETAVSAWTDPADAPWAFHYKVTAVDFSGNEGEAAAPAGVSGTGGEAPPAVAVLGDAVPNPFNPATTISFRIPADGRVHLRVFDVAGRLVRTLVAGATLPVGRHEAVWNGTADDGRAAAAGVYFYRLDAGEFTSTKRMTLVK